MEQTDAEKLASVQIKLELLSRQVQQFVEAMTELQKTLSELAGVKP